MKSTTSSYTAKAYQYLCGLFQAEKRNIEKICETVVDSTMQNVNHFISESPWEWGPVIERIGKDTSRLFAGHAEKIGLLIDESGWKKAGNQSVGVGRQYLGSLGKVDNGQSSGGVCQLSAGGTRRYHRYAALFAGIMDLRFHPVSESGNSV